MQKREPRKPRERGVDQNGRDVAQGCGMKCVSVINPQQRIGDDEVDQRGRTQCVQKVRDGIGHAAVQRDEQVLRITDRTHHAADGHGISQREQQYLGLDAMLLREPYHEWGRDDRERIVHQQGRAEAGAHYQREQEPAARPHTAERPNSRSARQWR